MDGSDQLLRKSVRAWPRSARSSTRTAGRANCTRCANSCVRARARLASGVSHDVYRRVHQELLQVRGELERLKQETGQSLKGRA